MSGLLFENATKIGSSGARNAFVSYLLACPVAQSEAQKWLGQLLNDDLQGLADEVCTVSSMGSTALDQFMRFYAENWSVSCSQWSQDVFVWYSLGKEFRGGRYLEIGGADGVTHSNTLMLQQALGWSGLLVEPDPGQCRLLRFNRGRHNTVLNLAAGSAGAVG